MSVEKYQTPGIELEFAPIAAALADATSPIAINDQPITGASGYGLTTGAGISGDGDDGLQLDGDQGLTVGLRLTAQIVT